MIPPLFGKQGKKIIKICTDLLLWDIKHLFYIIFCDFNFCGPKLTAEITGYTVICSNITDLSLYPRSPKGEGGMLFYLCPSVCPSARPRYFSSHFSQ
jgi:hypothetical protein